MKIYNATSAQLTMPLYGNCNLTVKPHSVSTEFLATPSFVVMLMSFKKPSDVAIIVSGPTEMTMCANIPGSIDFVVQSLDEALKRFMPDGTEDNPAIIEEQKPTVEEIKETKSPTATKIGTKIDLDNVSEKNFSTKLQTVKVCDKTSVEPEKLTTLRSGVVGIEETKVEAEFIDTANPIEVVVEEPKPVTKKRVVKKKVVVEKEETIPVDEEKPKTKKTTTRRKSTKKSE